MSKYTEILDRMAGMVEAFDARQKELDARIPTLKEALLSEHVAMDVATTNGDMETFQQHEAKARFIEYQIAAAEKEKATPAPVFNTLEEAIQLAREYQAAFEEAAAPLYERLQATLTEQEQIIKELKQLVHASYGPARAIGKHAWKVGSFISEIYFPSVLDNLVTYDAKRFLSDKVKK